MLIGKEGKIDAAKVQISDSSQRVKVYFRSLLWILLLPFAGNTLHAQVYEIIDYKKRKVIADSLMNELEKGALVIRLRTKHKKLVALNKSLNNKGLSKKQRKRTKKVIQTTIRERDKFNQEIVSAFYDLYDFSEFYVIHDTSSIYLKNGIKKGIFLNKQMEIDSSISISDKAYFILHEGSTNEKGIILNGLIVTTSEGDLPDRPFPNYFSIDDRLKIFLLNPAAKRKSGKKIVQEIMYRFSAFNR